MSQKPYRIRLTDCPWFPWAVWFHGHAIASFASCAAAMDFARDHAEMLAGNRRREMVV